MRSKDRELVIAKTDKTGRMAAMSKEEYKRGGARTHIKRHISRKDTEDIQRTLNGHTSMQEKTMGTKAGCVVM